MATLRYLNGANAGFVITLRGDELGGRHSEANILLDDACASRRHFVIIRDGSTFHLRDLDSANGTFVNGNRVTTHRLRDGDEVRIGELRLAFAQEALDASDFGRDPAPAGRPLLVLRGPATEGEDRVIGLGDRPLTIGRGSGQDLRLVDTRLSSLHAVIERVPGGWRVRDLGSKNGTFVNGKRLEAPHLLAAGDVLEFGDTRALFSYDVPTHLTELFERARRAVDPPPPPTPGPPPGPAPPAQDKPGLLDGLGRDLTALARNGKLDQVVGRREEIRRLGQVLAQKRKPNAILVGEAGVGKTCIVEGFAQRIASDDCPSAFKGKRVVEVSSASLVAGTKYRGELEERVQALLREAAADPDLILFIDEIHTIVGAGETSAGGPDVANQLKPALARGEVRVIGATTPAEYSKHIARDAALVRRFDVVWVDEPTRDEALALVEQLRSSYEEHHGVTILPEAVAAAVDLSMRYAQDRKLPDKALDLLDQACAREMLGTFRARAPEHVGPVDRAAVARVAAERYRVPVEVLLRSDEQRLERVEDALSRRVVGQPAAVDEVARALRAATAGLKDPRRPLAAFLFAGPSGTGKTELAKALAEHLFQDASRLVSIDMSEYMERHSVSRLVGAPPGYVGHGDDGQLTGPLQKNPFAVVLLDEIEKAHPDVLNTLLQLLDEGRLTDARGRRADYREAVIVLTSNLGSPSALEPARGRLGFGPDPADDDRAGAAPGDEADLDGARARVRQAVERHLRPELLNRLTGVVVFDPLSIEALEQVVDKRLAQVEARVAARGISLELSAAARRAIAEQAHDPRYNGRSVERLVDRLVAQPLASALLELRVKDGQRVAIVVRDGEVVLEP